MNIARKALAVAAVAAFGTATFAATAHAEGVAPRPSAKKMAAGDWAVAITKGDIQPRTITIQAGAKYTLTGTVEGLGEQATGTWKVTFNTAPGNGNVGCTATATNGGQVNGGTITWSNVSLGQAQASYTITCTYKNAYQPVINDKVMLQAPGHVFQGEGKPLADSQTVNYTIGGTLPTGSASPKPTTSTKPTTPVKDKDSNGGLAKTGF